MPKETVSLWPLGSSFSVIREEASRGTARKALRGDLLLATQTQQFPGIRVANHSRNTELLVLAV